MNRLYATSCVTVKIIPAKLDKLSRELGMVSVVRMMRIKNVVVIVLIKIPTPRIMKPKYRKRNPFAEEAL
jgi:hypothetical protein